MNNIVREYSIIIAMTTLVAAAVRGANGVSGLSVAIRRNPLSTPERMHGPRPAYEGLREDDMSLDQISCSLLFASRDRCPA